MLLCPGDTVTIGKCDPNDKVACYGDQYFILAKYNSADQLYNNIVQYNDNCQYQDGRKIREISCSVISYTVPQTESCARYGLTLACAGSANCGGVVPISMPGTPSAAPVGQPTLAPVKKRSIVGRDSFGAEKFAGEYEFIVFVIALAVFLFLSGTFALCLRFNPRFNHWFWSLEFFTKSFLGHQPVADQSDLKQVCCRRQNLKHLCPSPTPSHSSPANSLMTRLPLASLAHAHAQSEVQLWGYDESSSSSGSRAQSRL